MIRWGSHPIFRGLLCIIWGSLWMVGLVMPPSLQASVGSSGQDHSGSSEGFIGEQSQFIQGFSSGSLPFPTGWGNEVGEDGESSKEEDLHSEGGLHPEDCMGMRSAAHSTGAKMGWNSPKTAKIEGRKWLVFMSLRLDC
jgi:hypothetical protein